MRAAANVAAALLLAAISVALALNQQVVLAAQLSFAQVEPFDEAQLPEDRIKRPSARSSFETGLGRVARLDTYMPAALSKIAPTKFHIQTSAKYTHGVAFQIKSPEVRRGEQLDAERDFQYDLKVMAESGFDITKRTVIMIPGYLSGGDEVEWEHEARLLWLELLGPEVNVIVVSWPMSKTVYSQAVADTVLVARQLTVFLHYLAQLAGTNLRDQRFLDNIHLVGHSLGAHIAAFVGQDLGGRVGRITALDPAGPSFDCYPPEQRLDRGDAQLVEVLHTNAGKMHYVDACADAVINSLSSLLFHKRAIDGAGYFGINAQLGHIDYYANNGHTQEGCSDPLHACDHGRAADIYVDLLKYALELRTSAEGEDSPKSNNSTKLNRLWAFRADDYEKFLGGTQLAHLCPHLVQPNQVSMERAISGCAVPLMDFLTPLHELIGELRDDFRVNFEPTAQSEVQPRFYFKTTSQSQGESELLQHFVADHYLLKIYLDRESTRWDASQCSLGVSLRMQSGQVISTRVSELDLEHAILATPFAHPNGAQAHSELQELLSLLARKDDAQNDNATSPEGGNDLQRKIALHLQSLFPVAVDLEVVSRTESSYAASDCRFAYKELEVQPISVYTQSNVAIVSELSATTETPTNFMSTSEFAKRLASAPAHFISESYPRRIESARLELALVDQQ